MASSPTAGHVIPPPAMIEDFCQRHHIRSLALFGSALRADFNSDSDVDVLVAFEAGCTPDFFGLYALEEELSTLFGGRTIDLVTREALNRHLRDVVLQTAVILYDQA